MKKTRLLELVREIINEELELESQASDDAKRQGLEYQGFGRWGKDGKTTHVTQRGQLKPVVGASKQPVTTPTTPSNSTDNPKEPKQKKSTFVPDYAGQTPEQQVSDRIEDKFGFWDPGIYKGEEVRKLTGLKTDHLKAYDKYNKGNYEQKFSYHPESDEVEVHDLSEL